MKKGLCIKVMLEFCCIKSFEFMKARENEKDTIF